MRFQIGAVVAAISLITPAFAAPGTSVVRRQDSLFTSVHNVIGEVETTVTKDLASIVSLVTGDVTTGVVPTVLKDLTDIIGAIDSAIGILIPAVAETVLGLAVKEVEALVGDLCTVESIVKNIVDVLVNVVGGLAQEILTLVIGEVTAVLQLLDPFVEPLITFVEDVVASVEGADGQTSKVQTTATQITTVVHSIVIPVANTTSQ